MSLGEIKVKPAEWDKRFATMAEMVSHWSKDPEVKVGAVLVSPDRRRFAVGYNGFPRGIKDTRSRLRGDDRVPMTVHAELNAILNAGCDLTGWTLYVTRPPCQECAKAIAQARIGRIVSGLLPSSSSWRANCQRAAAMLREAGVEYAIDLAEDAL